MHVLLLKRQDAPSAHSWVEFLGSIIIASNNKDMWSQMNQTACTLINIQIGQCSRGISLKFDHQSLAWVKHWTNHQNLVGWQDQTARVVKGIGRSCDQIGPCLCSETIFLISQVAQNYKWISPYNCTSIKTQRMNWCCPTRPGVSCSIINLRVKCVYDVELVIVDYAWKANKMVILNFAFCLVFLKFGKQLSGKT